MSKKTKLYVASAMAAVMMVAMLPATGIAQSTYERGAESDEASVTERARPEYDPLGLRFGGFDVHPSLDVSAATTDNVFADENDPREDVVYSLRPRIDVASHWSRHELRGSIGAEDISYRDFSSDDVTNTDASASLRLDVRRSMQIGASLRAEHRAESRSSPDSPESSVHPIEYDTREARAYVQHSIGRVRMTAAYTNQDFDFEDGRTAGNVVIDQDNRDRTERTTSLRGEYAFSPRFALVGQAVYNTRDYDNPVPVNRDSEGRTFSVGANFDFTRLARGEVTVGHFEQDYDDPLTGAVDGMSVHANLDWFPTLLTTVNVSAQRSAEDSGLIPATSYLLSRAGVRVDHELRRNVIITGAVRREERDYQGIDRHDEVISAEASARYLMNRRVTVSGGYSADSQDSSGANRDRNFDIRRFFIALMLRL